MKLTVNKLGRLVCSIIASIIFVSLIMASSIVLAGCAIPAWKKDAKDAYKNAVFAPKIEEVIPGSLLTSSNSVSGVSSVGIGALSTVVSGNIILISQTGAPPNLDYDNVRHSTWETTINTCKDRIDYAAGLKSQILSGIDRLAKVGEWKNGSRLDIKEDGSIEYRCEDNLTGKEAWVVRLSADRTTVEMIELPRIVRFTDGKNTHQYSQYSSYNGEVFIDIDTYEGLSDPKNLTELSPMQINYREYRKAENGFINNIWLSFSSITEYGEDDLSARSINQISISIGGGNNETFYSYGQSMYDTIHGDYAINRNFFVADKKGEITLSINDDGYGPRYNVVASAHLLNIAKLHLAEEWYQELKLTPTVLCRGYECIGVELLDGTILYPEHDKGIFWEENVSFWGGTVDYYVAPNVYTTYIMLNYRSATTPTMEISMQDAVASFGFEFIDAGLDFSSLYNGKALEMLDNIRISGVKEMKDTEITFENIFTLYTAMCKYIEKKLE